MSNLRNLNHFGQSYWQDELSREMIDSGLLARRIDAQGLSGITTNPAIFHKAISQGQGYAREIERMAHEGMAATSIYRQLAIRDVGAACDALQPTFEATSRQDGYVSLEVSPHLAYDEEATVEEATRLWREVDRPNLLIKVPATPPGLRAVERLVHKGISVNITLIFDRHTYARAREAYLRALERRAEEELPLDRVTSVASIFLSRVDSAVDHQLHQRINGQVGAALRHQASSCLGKAAIASAKLIYADLTADLQDTRWQTLRTRGAQVQRIVWASTGTKNPSHRDVRYIEPLIGPHTISTMPPDTAAAFDDHGIAAATAGEGFEEAAEMLMNLREVGVELDAVCHQLLSEGVDKFIAPHDKLVAAIERQIHLAKLRRNGAKLCGMADRLRVKSIEMTSAAGSGHPSSCLSAAELMSALFFHEMHWDPGDPSARDVDRFILSKGHAAPILWAALDEAGALQEDPMTLRDIDSTLEGHPTPRNPWIQVATGSLGQGLAAANGAALANRLDGIDARIFCLLGDGECSEGSVWEAAQFAARHDLESLVAIVDANGQQQSKSAPTAGNEQVLAQRFSAFGWRCIEIDGHDAGEILAALEESRGEGPTAIIARTVKGKGVSFLEGQPGWHGKPLSDEEKALALAELNPGDPIQVAPRRVGLPSRLEPEQRPITWNDYAIGEEVATRQAFGDALTLLAEHYPDLVVLDGDVQNSTKTQAFGEAFPERFFEADIAEQAMLGAALGLAVSGKRPCAATFAAFLSRGYDFLRMAAHSQPPHMLVCGSHAGVSIGEDGPSQMGLEDIAMFRALHGSTVLYPSDAVSAQRLTRAAMETPGLVYLRTNRGKTPVLYGPEERFAAGGSKTLIESPDDQVTLVAAGVTVHTALEASRRLLEENIYARVIDAYSVQPLDVANLQRAMRETGTLLVVEDHGIAGGLGEAVSRQIGRLGRVFNLGVARESRSGSPEALQQRHRISSSAIVQEVEALAA